MPTTIDLTTVFSTEHPPLRYETTDTELSIDNSTLTINEPSGLVDKEVSITAIDNLGQRSVIRFNLNTIGVIEHLTGFEPRDNHYEIVSGEKIRTLLLEPESNNFLLNSEDIGGSGWISGGGNIVSEKTDQTYQGYSVQRVSFETGALWKGETSISTASNTQYTNTDILSTQWEYYSVSGDYDGTTYTFSCYARAVAGLSNVLKLKLRGSDGVVTAYLNPDSTGGVYEFAALQIEAGEEPTSYIPTYGSAATRAQEAVKFTIPQVRQNTWVLLDIVEKTEHQTDKDILHIGDPEDTRYLAIRSNSDKYEAVLNDGAQTLVKSLPVQSVAAGDSTKLLVQLEPGYFRTVQDANGSIIGDFDSQGIRFTDFGVWSNPYVTLVGERPVAIKALEVFSTEIDIEEEGRGDLVSYRPGDDLTNNTVIFERSTTASIRSRRPTLDKYPDIPEKLTHLWLLDNTSPGARIPDLIGDVPLYNGVDDVIGTSDGELIPGGLRFEAGGSKCVRPVTAVTVKNIFVAGKVTGEGSYFVDLRDDIDDVYLLEGYAETIVPNSDRIIQDGIRRSNTSSKISASSNPSFIAANIVNPGTTTFTAFSRYTRSSSAEEGYFIAVSDQEMNDQEWEEVREWAAIVLARKGVYLKGYEHLNPENDPSLYILDTVGADTPRDSHYEMVDGEYVRTLLLEPEATNIIDRHVLDFSFADSEASVIESPIGTEAWRITKVGSNGYVQYPFGSSNGNSRSIWARRSPGETGTTCRLLTRMGASDVFTLTDEWQRFDTVVDLSQTSGDRFYLVDFRFVTDVTSVDIWAPQETTTPLSSYIPTYGAPATRKADIVRFSSDWWDKTEGSIVMWMDSNDPESTEFELWMGSNTSSYIRRDTNGTRIRWNSRNYTDQTFSGLDPDLRLTGFVLTWPDVSIGGPMRFGLLFEDGSWLWNEKTVSGFNPVIEGFGYDGDVGSISVRGAARFDTPLTEATARALLEGEPQFDFLDEITLTRASAATQLVKELPDMPEAPEGWVFAFPHEAYVGGRVPVRDHEGNVVGTVIQGVDDTVGTSDPLLIREGWSLDGGDYLKINLIDDLDVPRSASDVAITLTTTDETAVLIFGDSENYAATIWEGSDSPPETVGSPVYSVNGVEVSTHTRDGLYEAVSIGEPVTFLTSNLPLGAFDSISISPQYSLTLVGTIHGIALHLLDAEATSESREAAQNYITAVLAQRNGVELSPVEVISNINTQYVFFD